MRRLRNFAMFQRAAWRALFRRPGRPVEIPPPDLAVVGHPSQLCRCTEGPPGLFDDHRPDCQWLAAMCRACGGTGWCERCGGDGTAVGP